MQAGWENLGLKETLNPTKRVCIGSLGAGMFDGRLPSINIGDNDSGFIGSADGVIDIYTNSARAGYIDSSGLHMLRNITTTGTVNSGSGILTTNGDVYGSVWGNKWLSSWLSIAFTSRDARINTCATYDWTRQYFLQDVRLGSTTLVGPSANGGYASLTASPGFVLTAILDGDTRRWPMPDSPDAAYARPLQKNINGNWYNVSEV